MMAGCFKFCRADSYAGWEAIDLIYFGVSDAEPVLSEPQSCINEKAVVGKKYGTVQKIMWTSIR